VYFNLCYLTGNQYYELTKFSEQNRREEINLSPFVPNARRPVGQALGTP